MTENDFIYKESDLDLYQTSYIKGKLNIHTSVLIVIIYDCQCDQLNIYIVGCPGWLVQTNDTTISKSPGQPNPIL